MKLTIIRTDKNHLKHVTQKTLDDFLKRIATDTKRASVEQLRSHIPLMRSGFGYDRINDLPRVYPCAVLTKDANGNIVAEACTGVVLLTVGPLPAATGRQEAKRMAAQMPSTLAAFDGSSGLTVKILVCAEPAEGPLPSDEGQMDRFCQRAYDTLVPVYEALLPAPVIRQQAGSTASFRMTLDADPYVNRQATPFRITTTGEAPAARQPAAAADNAFGWDVYAQNEALYKLAYSKALDDLAATPQADSAEALIAATAHHLCLAGMDQEEAVLHISMRARYHKGYSDDKVRTIVAATYAADDGSRGQTADDSDRVGREMRMLIGYMESRYVLRYNTVMGYAEYRPNNSWVHDWRPVDERAINGMTTDARLAGLNVWDRDIARYVRSDKVRVYDPVADYLWDLSGKWDGRDHITQLARTVPTDNPQWEHWFRTWFLGMVAQWTGRNRRYGNSVAPLLISRQGYNKSTFCRSLLPEELQWGYTDNLSLDEKRPVLQAMSQMLLINLDEFNQISARTQEGFLKNIIQLARVQAKRPYGKHIEEFPRLASFIATTNVSDPLADPSGSRRFIGVELTGPIDVSRRPNHRQLFAQALALITAGERYWFDDNEVRQLMQHNRQFQSRPAAELFFHEHFVAAPAGDPAGEWITATAIYGHLRPQAGTRFSSASIARFGRILSNIDGLMQKRSAHGTLYFVIKKS